MPTAHVSRAAPRVVALVFVLLVAAMGAYSIGVARAADPRLTEADQALQKAAALLEASQTGGAVSPQAQKRFDKSIAQALADVAAARAEIVTAIEAADS
jgi:Tfp pilus assembly protein PilE